MRTVPKLYPVLVLAFLGTGPAAAQRNRFDTGLLYNKSVQKELKLSDDQTSAVTKIAEAGASPSYVRAIIRSIQAASASSTSARTSASLRPVRAGT